MEASVSTVGFSNFFFAAFVGAAKFVVMKMEVTHGLCSPLSERLFRI